MSAEKYQALVVATQRKGHLKVNHSHAYCGLGSGTQPNCIRTEFRIPEFALIEHSFAGLRHSFVVRLVHVAHQLPVHVI